jgi:hypothetical protein
MKLDRTTTELLPAAGPNGFPVGQRHAVIGPRPEPEQTRQGDGDARRAKSKRAGGRKRGRPDDDRSGLSTKTSPGDKAGPTMTTIRTRSQEGQNRADEK